MTQSYRNLMRNQLQGQNIDDFSTDLTSRAAHCEFQTLKIHSSKIN